MKRFFSGRCLLHLAVLAWGASALPARASHIIINQEVDLIDFVRAGNDAHYGDAPLASISNGDDVTIHFNFARGDQLRLANSGSSDLSFATGWPWLESWGAEGAFTLSNVSIALISPRVAGTAVVDLWRASDTDGTVHLGPLGYLTLGAQSSVLFSGITASYHVESVPGDTNTYQPWIHGYFDGLDESVVRAKKGERKASAAEICYDDFLTTTEGSSSRTSSPPENARVATVADGASTLGLILMSGLALTAFSRRRR